MGFEKIRLFSQDHKKTAPERPYIERVLIFDGLVSTGNQGVRHIDIFVTLIPFLIAGAEP